MRNRNIEAFAARALKLPHRGFKIFRGHLQQLVLNTFVRLQGEQSVNNGRTAVRNRVSHDTVSINRGGRRYRFVRHALLRHPACGIERKIGQNAVCASALNAEQCFQNGFLLIEPAVLCGGF